MFYVMGILRATIVPCLFALAAWYCIIPGYFYVHNDPDFGYLMNSLRITEGIYAWHVDHPGSILQLLGAAVIEIVKFVKHEPDGLQALVSHLDLIYYCTLAASLATLLGAQFLLGWVLFRRGGGFLVAMAAQLTPAFFAEVPNALVRLNSETTMAAAGLLVAAAFVPFLEPSQKKNRWHFILFGCAIGAAMATKANVWPIALLALVPMFAAERSIKASFTIMASILFVFLTLTIPAWPRYKYLLGWITSLFTHTGLYGDGATQVTSLNNLRKGLGYYIDIDTGRHQVLAIALSFSLILVAISKRLRIYIPVLMAFLAIGFLVLKHPATRYAMAFVPLVAIAFLYLPRLPKAFTVSLATLLVFLASDGLLIRSRMLYRDHWNYSQQNQALLKELNGPNAGCAVVLTGGAGGLPIPEAGLMEGHGEMSANYPWPERMNALFPRYFLLRDDGVARFGKRLPLMNWASEVSHFPCQIFASLKWWPQSTLLMERNFLGEFHDVGFNNEENSFRLYRHEGELRSRWPELYIGSR